MTVAHAQLVRKCGKESKIPAIMAADALAGGMDTTANTGRLYEESRHISTKPFRAPLYTHSSPISYSAETHMYLVKLFCYYSDRILVCNLRAHVAAKHKSGRLFLSTKLIYIRFAHHYTVINYLHSYGTRCSVFFL
jgi:hypothetical protein